jgi:hypothetical protein
VRGSAEVTARLTSAPSEFARCDRCTMPGPACPNDLTRVQFACPVGPAHQIQVDVVGEPQIVGADVGLQQIGVLLRSELVVLANRNCQ